MSTLKKAIDEHNFPQSRKSIEVLAQQGVPIPRDVLRNVLFFARRNNKPAALRWIESMVDSMESRFGLAPHRFEYHALMYCLGLQGQTEAAHGIVQRMQRQGIEPNTMTYNTLLGIYKRANDVEGALSVWDEMASQGVERDISTYNTLLALLGPSQPERAFDIYTSMRIAPDAHTYTTMLSLCARFKNTDVGDAICTDMTKDPAKLDTATVNALFQYQAAVAEDLSPILETYHAMPREYNVKPDRITFNILLDSCLRFDNPARAFTFFRDMQAAQITPDVYTYDILMNAEVKRDNPTHALQLFQDMLVQEVQPNARVLSTLLRLAPKADPTTLDAMLDLAEVYHHLDLDAKAYNALLSGLAQQGRSVQAQRLYDSTFRDRLLEQADIATYTSLMMAYINDKLIDDAMDIYYALRDHHQSPKPSSKTKHIKLDTQFYTSMISTLTKMPGAAVQEDRRLGALVDDDVHADSGSSPALLSALRLFNDMRHLMIRPDAHVYTALLTACAAHRDAYVLEHVHKLIRMDLFMDPDTAVYNALMDAYNRVGDGHTVLQVWETLTMFGASATEVDSTTISIVLDSCGHNGFGYRAHDIWQTVQRRGYPLNLNNYTSYIECLCRSTSDRRGWDEAWQVVQTQMRRPSDPYDTRPIVDDKTMNTLLSFARKKGIDPAEVEAWQAREQ